MYLKKHASLLITVVQNALAYEKTELKQELERKMKMELKDPRAAAGDEEALDTYKTVRKRFFEAGDATFGPGVMSMAEYYFMKKNGRNPFAMLFSEPRAVYDQWIEIFKGEQAVERLLEKAAGPAYRSPLIESVKRNDPLRLWNILYMMSRTAAGEAEGQARGTGRSKSRQATSA